MKQIAFTLVLMAISPCCYAAEKTLAGTIDKIDPATRTIVIDGKSMVVSPKTKFVVDGQPATIDVNCVGKNAVVVYDDTLDVAMSIVLGETVSNDDAVQSLGGIWQCIAAEEVGREHDAKMVHTQNRTLTLNKHRLTMERVSQGKLSKYEGLFVLDALTNEFDFVGKAPDGQYVEWIGIYSLTDDELKLCYRYVKEPGVSRPTDFVTDSQKPNISVFYTYKRMAASDR